MNLRKLSLLCFLAFALCLSAATPKYIFMFIGDGMGMGHVMTTQTYNRLTLKNDKPLLMMQFPIASQAMTYSYDNTITDSAAAGTALATGHKTRNGMIGMNPDTISVTSVARVLKDKGYGIGITTTVPIDDATPAVYYAHQPSRKMYTEIGLEMAKSDFDFFAGSSIRGDKSVVYPAMKSNGYTLVYGINELNKNLDKNKVLLLSPLGDKLGHAGYTIDARPEALTLPQITKAAINHLTRVSPKKFFLMVEGGNIDWAAHSNDGATVVKEVLNFDESLKLAYDFYLAHPKETLIIVTADHNTGGMTAGVNGGPSKITYASIDAQKISKETFSAYCRDMAKSKKKITWDEMKNYISENLGLYSTLSVSEKQNSELHNEFIQVFENNNSHDNKTLYATYNSFTEKVFNVLQHAQGFGWTTNNHTGNLVPVYAIGAGAEVFSRINNNIEIPQKIAKLSGNILK